MIHSDGKRTVSNLLGQAQDRIEDAIYRAQTIWQVWELDDLETDADEDETGPEVAQSKR